MGVSILPPRFRKKLEGFLGVVCHFWIIRIFVNGRRIIRINRPIEIVEELLDDLLPVEQECECLSHAQVVEGLSPHVEPDVSQTRWIVVKNCSLGEKAALDGVRVEPLCPHLWVARDIVIIQLTLLEQFDGKIFVPNDDSLEFINIVLADVRAIFLCPVVFPAPECDRPSLLDVRFVQNVRTRAGNQLEVVITQIGCAIDVLE